MDVKGFVFCQQHSSTSHDYSVDSHREDRAKKVEDERRKKKGWGVRRGKAVWETGNKVQEEKKNERRVSIGVGKKKKKGVDAGERTKK